MTAFFQEVNNGSRILSVAMPNLRKDFITLGLHSDILERLQHVNEYGGAAATFLIRKEFLDAIDKGANNNDITLIRLKTDMKNRASAWKNIEDHTQFSRFFDTYCEATFYLAGCKHIALEGIPRSQLSTPDFRTEQQPQICFEVKTLDIEDPISAYPRQMWAGLEANIIAREEAQRNGVGFSTQVISPHGTAKTWPEIIEKTMSKLSGHVKHDQYKDAPTFLVANLGRLSVRIDPDELTPKYSIPREDTLDGHPFEVSGQLWTIANHQLNDDFHCVGYDGQRETKVIERAGLLRDHPFIQGIIFMNEPWSEFELSDDWRDSYRFLGVWNEDCTLTCEHSTRVAARRVLDALCERVVSTR